MQANPIPLRPSLRVALGVAGRSARFLPCTARCALLLLLLAFLAGCSANSNPITQNREHLVNTLKARGLDPDEVILPYGMTDTMRRFAKDTSGKPIADAEKLDRLRFRLLDPQYLSLEYEWGYTGTAIEVFEMQRANCLAFTNLFVGMAREVGVEVYFVTVDGTLSYRKTGDLVVVSDHIAVGYGPQPNRQIYDFAEERPDDYRFIRKISDLTAVAMFHSNRGGEALQAGLVPEAVDWLHQAVAIDPFLATGWVNLGVALRRLGDLAGAEEAYKRALELDPKVLSTYHNLAAMLRRQGREREALRFEETLASSPNRNPFTYLSLGDISLANGRADEAQRFYRKAARLGEDADIYAALGELALANGQVTAAKRMLRKARKTKPESESARVRRLATALAERSGT